MGDAATGAEDAQHAKIEGEGEEANKVGGGEGGSAAARSDNEKTEDEDTTAYLTKGGDACIGQSLGAHQGKLQFTKIRRTDGSRLGIGDFCFVLPTEKGTPLHIGKITGIFYNTKTATILLDLQWYWRPSNVFHTADAVNGVPASLTGKVARNEVFETSYVEEKSLEEIGSMCKVYCGSEVKAYDEKFSSVPEEQRANNVFVCRRIHSAFSNSLAIDESTLGDDATSREVLLQPKIFIKDFSNGSNQGQKKPAAAAPRASEAAVTHAGDKENENSKGPSTLKVSFKSSSHHPSGNITNNNAAAALATQLPYRNPGNKAGELGAHLVRFEKKVPDAFIPEGWKLVRDFWRQTTLAADSIRFLSRALLDLEKGLEIRDYTPCTDFSNLESWRIRVAGLHTYATIEYQIRAYINEACRCFGMVSDIEPIARGKRSYAHYNYNNNAPGMDEEPRRAKRVTVNGGPNGIRGSAEQPNGNGNIFSKDGRPRWSLERYQRGHRTLINIMSNFGALDQETALPRPVIRQEARKTVGDTGLLDHLLKHMLDQSFEGSVMRRREGKGGLLEYWLEPTDEETIMPVIPLRHDRPARNNSMPVNRARATEQVQARQTVTKYRRQEVPAYEEEEEEEEDDDQATELDTTAIRALAATAAEVGYGIHTLTERNPSPKIVSKQRGGRKASWQHQQQTLHERHGQGALLSSEMNAQLQLILTGISQIRDDGAKKFSEVIERQNELQKSVHALNERLSGLEEVLKKAVSTEEETIPTPQESIPV